MTEKYPELDAGGHPFWSGAVVGLLSGIETGLVPRNQSAAHMNQLIHELREVGMLKNYGDLEKYAREQQLPLYLAAMPIEEFEPMQGFVCVDPISNEPRPYALNLLVGEPHPEDTNGQRVCELSADQETNVARLTDQTGVFKAER